MKDAVIFREMEILRAPGFPRGGPRLRDLAPGINLVRGPNTSGKSTTARAVQQALWPVAEDARLALVGRFDVGDDTWRIEVDGSSRHFQRDGRDALPPALPPSSSRSRYRLSLQDLFTGDDRHLAELIRRESVGGYDIPTAAEALGFGAGGAKTTLTREYAAARKAVEDARENARETRQDRARLEELTRELGEAESRAGKVEGLELALELGGARQILAETERALSLFPDELAELRGNEPEELDRLASNERTLRDERDEAERKIADARDRLDALDLGPDGIPESVMKDLDSKSEDLRGLDVELRTARSELAAAEARVRETRVAAGSGASVEVEPEIDLPGGDLLGRLDALLREAEEMRARLGELDTAIDRLASMEEEETARPEDRDRIDAELRLLREWLRAAPAPAEPAGGLGRPLLWALIALTATGLVGAAAGLLLPGGVSLATASGIVALAAAVVIALVATRGGPDVVPDERGEVEARAAREGHGPGDRGWSVEEVRSRVAELERASVAAREAEDRHRRLSDLRTTRAGLETAADQLAMRQLRTAAELGFGPDVLDLSLHVLGTRLVAHESARREAEATRARVEELQERIASVLAAVRRLIAPFGHTPVDSSAVRAALDELRTAREAHATATRELAGASRSLEGVARREQEVRRERTELFERVFDGGTPDPAAAERRIRELAVRLEDWREARDEFESARRNVRRIEEELRDADTDPEARRDLSALEVDLAEARAARGRVVELREEIARIGQLLETARKSHDLERALERLDAARRDLAAQREADIRDEVGRVLAEHVRSITVDRNRPRVFERATEILGRITRGRYRLDLSDMEGSFRAIDTVDGVGRSLEELSAGTRIQVLLAVRIAFVETQESGVAVPLLLDEVLANCDDIRAQAIIDAMIELARAGRQIFYFTAQSDELAKWRRALEGSGVAWAECALGPGEAGGDGDRGTGFDWAEDAVVPAVPAPAGRDHAAWGRELGVPPWDPRDSHTALHPWYLIEEVDALHAVLRNGIFTWGSLDGFVRHAGSTADDAVVAAHLRAEPWARLAGRFAKLWMQGRGVPVTRETLKESGAVSDVFLDRVADLAARLEGDARDLMEALRGQEIARWQSPKSDELEDYLSRTGHLDGRERLAEQEIRLRLMEWVGDLPEGTGPVDVERFIRRLSRGPAPVEAPVDTSEGS